MLSAPAPDAKPASWRYERELTPGTGTWRVAVNPRPLVLLFRRIRQALSRVEGKLSTVSEAVAHPDTPRRIRLVAGRNPDAYGPTVAVLSPRTVWWVLVGCGAVKSPRKPRTPRRAAGYPGDPVEPELPGLLAPDPAPSPAPTNGAGDAVVAALTLRTLGQYLAAVEHDMTVDAVRERISTALRMLGDAEGALS